MKSLLRLVTVVLMMAIILPVNATNIVPVAYTRAATSTEDPRMISLMERLNEIKGMDRDALTRSEKKNLRKEVKSLKKEAKKITGGVYLSVAAIIIIILLVIILL